jgi:serine/threonine-protein kinase
VTIAWPARIPYRHARAARHASAPCQDRLRLAHRDRSAKLDERGFDERYLRLELLGRGGMGEVHLCKDALVGRDVAMKHARAPRVLEVGEAVPSASLRDVHDRFVREARVQGQLEHPSVVPVYDLGLTPGRAPYFTMKRVRGLSLAEIIQALARGNAEAQSHYGRRKLLSAFSSACLAVDFAHARGVLHRDLKPGNLMLGDFGEVYVLDWGLAKVIGRDAVGALPGPTASWEDEAPTQVARYDSAGTGEGMMGTPGYMSPEQAQTGVLDGRSDVYALGAILFELLALEPLHAIAPLPQVLASTVGGVDARPSLRPRGEDVPPELDAICVRATALAPDDRDRALSRR